MSLGLRVLFLRVEARDLLNLLLLVLQCLITLLQVVFNLFDFGLQVLTLGHSLGQLLRVRKLLCVHTDACCYFALLQ